MARCRFASSCPSPGGWDRLRKRTSVVQEGTRQERIAVPVWFGGSHASVRIQVSRGEVGVPAVCGADGERRQQNRTLIGQRLNLRTSRSCSASLQKNPMDAPTAPSSTARSCQASWKRGQRTNCRSRGSWGSMWHSGLTESHLMSIPRQRSFPTLAHINPTKRV